MIKLGEQPPPTVIPFMQPGDDWCLMLVVDFSQKKTLPRKKDILLQDVLLKNIGSNFNRQPPISTNKIEINHWLVLNRIHFQRHFGAPFGLFNK